MSSHTANSGYEERWAGIPVDRVVAVVARLDEGREQIGSGYLIGPRLVLTAAHCTRDKNVVNTAGRSLSLVVYRKSDGASALVDRLIESQPYDVAVLGLDTPLGPDSLPPPQYARVDQSHASELSGCEAVGYPLFQYDTAHRQRNSAQIKGTIRTSDEDESGYLLLRDPLLDTVVVPQSARATEQEAVSVWGGLSGALVFYHGLALGIIVEHHPRQGASALRVAPFGALASASDPPTHALAAALDLPALADLPEATQFVLNSLLAAPAAQEAPSQLPSLDIDLKGRDADCAEVVDRLTHNLADSGGLPVVLVSGTPGIGKTSVAVHVGHHLAARYPDGQLFVLLRGTDTRALDPKLVLSDFLRALGVAGTAIPEGLKERADLYRTRLWGRKVLIILDDAGSEEQVRPLLPGSPTCGIIITSRNRLPGLRKSHQITLGVLQPTDALDVIRALIGNERVAAESEAAAEIVNLCDCLPLALRIVGARLALRPGLSLSRFARRLRDEKRRLGELMLTDTEFRAAVSLSYDVLSAQDQKAFRRLGLLEGAHFTTWRLAALLDVEIEVADRLIESLLQSGLIDSLGQDAVGEERFQMHDLLRLYARERLEAEDPADERMAAFSRAAGTFLSLALLAAGSLEPGEDFLSGVDPEAIREIDDADLAAAVVADPMEWFAVERATLVIAIERAAKYGMHSTAIALTKTLATFFDYHARWDDWDKTSSLALAASRQNGDRSAEAAILRSIGRLERYRGRWDEAVVRNDQSLEIAREIGDEHCEAETLVDVIRLSWYRGAYADARQAYYRGMELFTRHRYRYGQARCEASISLVLREEGRHAAAAYRCELALPMFREVGDVRWIASALTALGEVYRDQGRYLDAERCITESLPMLRSLGFRWWEAVTLRTLGDIYLALRRYADAEVCLTAAQEALREFGMLWWEAVVQVSLAQVCCAQRRFEEAREYIAAGADTFRERGDRRWAAVAAVVSAQIEFDSSSAEVDIEKLAELAATLQECHDPTWTMRAMILEAEVLHAARRFDEEDQVRQTADRLNEQRHALSLSDKTATGPLAADGLSSSTPPT